MTKSEQSRADSLADAATVLLNYPPILGANDAIPVLECPEYWGWRASLAFPELTHE
jgi:hypothetical protein